MVGCWGRWYIEACLEYLQVTSGMSVKYCCVGSYLGVHSGPKVSYLVRIFLCHSITPLLEVQCSLFDMWPPRQEQLILEITLPGHRHYLRQCELVCRQPGSSPLPPRHLARRIHPLSEPCSEGSLHHGCSLRLVFYYQSARRPSLWHLHSRRWWCQYRYIKATTKDITKGLDYILDPNAHYLASPP